MFFEIAMLCYGPASFVAIGEIIMSSVLMMLNLEESVTSDSSCPGMRCVVFSAFRGNACRIENESKTQNP